MSFAIQSTDGRHLGFLLFAGGTTAGDCIFRSLPNESSDFELPESEYLFELQEQGEFRWTANGMGSFMIEDPSGKSVAEIENGHLKSSRFEFNVVRLGSDD